MKSSILLISSDRGIADAVSTALGSIEDAQINREEKSVAQLNGAAVKMAADHDVVIFATDPSNASDLAAIEVLTEQRGEDTVYLALTDGDLPLSKVRALNRVGVDDVLPFPLPEAELSELVRDWIKKKKVERIDAVANEGRSGRVIAVSQARGGIGATTVAVNLADQLQERKGAFRKGNANRVIVVDFDLQFGTVGDFLDLEEQEGLLQLASDNFLPDAMWVDQSVARLPSGLTVLAAPQKFAPLDALEPAQIAALLDVLKGHYDYIVIDLPRALVSWIEPVLEACDQYLIVTDLTVPSVRASKRIMEFVMADHPTLPIEIVINHEKKPMIMANHHKEAAKALDSKFTYWIAHDPKSARQAVDYGKPLSEVAGRSDLSKGIAALAKGMRAALPAETAKARV